MLCGGAARGWRIGVLFDIAMAGRGRGRGRKKSPKSNGSNVSRVGVPAAAGTVEDNNITNNNHVGRNLMLSTSLDTLLRIEATIALTTRGKGSISIDNFYDMATSHEWLSLSSSKDTVDNEKIHTQQQVSKSIAEISTEVYELVSQLSETERLLFDFVAISTCDLRNVSTNIYPLYQLNGSRLEIIQQPNSQLPKEGVLLPARSEVLGTMCHLSHKCYSFNNVVVNSNAIQKWWTNAKNVAQVILDHRKQAETIKKKDKSKAANGVKSPIVSTNNTESVASTAQSSTTNGDKKMTLEERIRARSLLNPSNTNKAKSSKVKESSNQSENKTMLELANALRSYSQCRGIASSSGSSALDRLKSRGGESSNTSAKNIARLTVMDLMRDARVTWTSVVNESADKDDSSSGNKSRPRGGGGKVVVSIDLSRVLFQIRLKMKPNKDVSDKRQMEMQILELLEKLSELVPTWIQLRKAPTLMTGSLSSKKRKTSSGDIAASDNTTATTKQQKTNIRQCIIVIRNDAVNYNTDVRLKLGGRSHITPAKNGSKSAVAKGTKRSLEEIEGKKQSSLADAIVPPSFLQTYGKALTEEPKKKGNRTLNTTFDFERE